MRLKMARGRMAFALVAAGMVCVPLAACGSAGPKAGAGDVAGDTVERAIETTSTSIDATASTLAPTTTAAPAPEVNPVAPSAPVVTAPPTQPVGGTVAFLNTVSFAGSIDGQPDVPLATGKACSGRDGYADLGPGGGVIVADQGGVALATTTLGGGKTSVEIKNTASERQQREELIDAIYGLRKALVAGDPVKVAQLNLDRANLRLKDLNTPGPPPPFEGHAFEAQWCALPFSAPALPVRPAYQITVTHRGTTTFTQAQLGGSHNGAALIIG